MEAEEFVEKFLEDNNIDPDNIEWHHVIIMMEEYADEQSRERAINYGEHLIRSHFVKKIPLKYDEWILTNKDTTNG
jgi:hypothetical protein